MLKILKYHLLVTLALLLFISYADAAQKKIPNKNLYIECVNNSIAPFVNDDYDVTCTDFYHHYSYKKAPTIEEHNPASTNVKIASYNIYRLNEGSAANKDLTATAKMMDQWDVVAVVEIMTTVKLFKGYYDARKEGKSAPFPQHLVLLQKLRINDSSWSLLLSPFTQDGGELFAFYYRASKVAPQETKYCTNFKDTFDNVIQQKPKDSYPFEQLYYREKKIGGELKILADQKKEVKLPELGKEFACLPDISELTEEPIIDILKWPFMATFQSGKFQFTMLVSHIRFNKLDPDIENDKIEQMYNYFHPRGAMLSEIKKSNLTKMIKKCQRHSKIFNKLIPQVSANILNQKYLPDDESEALAAIKIIKNQQKLTKDLKEILVNDEKKYKSIRKFFEKYGVEYGINIMDERKKYMINKMIIPRYYEMAQMLQLVDQVEQANTRSSIIFSGDFNVGESTNDSAFWRRLEELTKLRPYIDTKTSIKRGDHLANRYDHFFVNPRKTSNCFDDEGIRGNAYNFMTQKNIEFQNSDTIGYVDSVSDHLPIFMECSTN